MVKNSLKAYETDSSQLVGNATKIIQPKSIEEVQNAVKSNINMTLRGGGTGLAGGAVPMVDAVLDLSKLDKIEEFNLDKKTIVVEAGLVLDDLQDFLHKHNLEFPINPSSHSICTIGGMVATNAVGSRAVKYGKTSDWILWLDVVNSEGKVERKNKSDFGDFAGMEGITGSIVRICLKLTNTKKREIELIEFNNLEDLISKVKKAKQRLETSMIEFLDKEVSELIGLKKAYHLFIERETEESMKKNESVRLYRLRDQIYPKLAEAGFLRIEDPKVIIDKSAKLIDWLEERKIPCYGHISVGILHPCFSKEQEKFIPEMMKLVKRLNGQITGEHGIGLLKKEFVDPNDKKLLVNMKKRLDPSNKFNPGKVI